MKKKVNKALSVLLTLAMVLGLLPATALAESGDNKTVTVDLAGKYSDGDTLYVFNEQYNGDYMTDYASEMKKITLPIGHDVWWKYDGNAKTLYISDEENKGEGYDVFTEEQQAAATNWNKIPWMDFDLDCEYVEIKGAPAPVSTLHWFNSFEKLSEIKNLDQLNTSSVTNMRFMFTRCSSLSELDLSGFDISSVTSMELMFATCGALTTIYAAPDANWYDSERNMQSMFRECTRLVGGSGTAYDGNHQNGDYARIDDPDNDQPGYFTAPRTYPVWVQGVQVTSTNKNDVLKDGGKVKFTPATGTEAARLTLTNANITGADWQHPSKDMGMNAGIASLTDLTLELVGQNNRITATEHGFGAASSGIVFSDSELTVTGDGALEVTSGKADVSFAIYVQGMTMESGAVKAVGGEGETASVGMMIVDALTVEGGSLTVIGGAVTETDAHSNGVASEDGSDSSIIINGGTVVASGQTGAFEKSPSLTGYDPAPVVTVSANADGSDAAKWNGTDDLKGFKYVKLNSAPRIQADWFALEQESFVYDGERHKPAVVITPAGSAAGVTLDDLNIIYLGNPLDVGTPSVKISASGNSGFVGSVNIGYTIEPRSIADARTDLPATITVGDSVGRDWRLIVTANGADRTLRDEYDFWPVLSETTINGNPISSEDDLWKGVPGIYEVVVEGIGNYTGKFTINCEVKKIQLPGTVSIKADTETIGVGTRLTASYSEGSFNIGFRWFMNDVLINGADNYLYEIPDGTTNGTKFHVEVFAEASEMYAKGSVASDKVEVGKSALTGNLSIVNENGKEYDSGDVPDYAIPGEKLTAKFDNDTAEYNFAWYRDGRAIPGAAGREYTVTKDDYGAIITVFAVGKGAYTDSVPSVNSVRILPGAPVVRQSANAGNGSVTVNWSVEKENAAWITGFTVSLFDADMNEIVHTDRYRDVREHTFNGLENGKTYYASVYTLYENPTQDPGNPDDDNAIAEIDYFDWEAKMLAAADKAEADAIAENPSLDMVNNATNEPGPDGLIDDNAPPWGPGGFMRSLIRNEGMVAVALEYADAIEELPAKLAKENGSLVPGGGGGGGGGITTQYTLTYNTGGGSEVKATKHESGTTVDLTATPAKEGFTFDGWYSEAALTNKITSVKMDGDKTVYAGWKEAGSVDPGHDCPSARFTDVKESDWFHEYVDYVVSKGLMKGVSADKFAPGMTTTRAMIVTMLYRLEMEEGSGENTIESPSSVSFADTFPPGGRLVLDTGIQSSVSFEDVEPGSWYEEAVKWAAENGIVKGYSKTKFGPTDEITREQFAAILYRYVQMKGGGFTGAWMFDLDFADASDISDWADEAMHWCVMKGIFEGDEKGKLRPRGKATRAEAATILMRFIENVK